MTEFDPRVADRLHRIALVAQDIALRADVGPYEVGVLQELMEEADELSGSRADRERRDALRRFHWSGRAVDMPPRNGLRDWIRNHRT